MGKPQHLVQMFSCHVTAHAPVRAIQELQRKYTFGPQDIRRIVIEASDKVLSHHADREPATSARRSTACHLLLRLRGFAIPGADTDA